MSDLEHIKELLTTLIKQQTNLSAMLQAVEKQGNTNAESYKTLANQNLEINQNFKVIMARLDVLEEDSKENSKLLKKATDKLNRIAQVSADSKEILDTLHSRFIEESDAHGKKAKSMQEQIDEIQKAGTGGQ